MRFLGLLALLLVLVDAMRPELEPLLANPTARHLANGLRQLGWHAVLGGADGRTVCLGAFRAQIILECTFLMSGCLYASFVLAQGTSLRAKLAGLLAGLPALAVLNQLRLVAFMLAAARWPAMGEWLHAYPAQLLSILSTAGACALWLVMQRASPLAAAGHFGLRLAFWAALAFWPWSLAAGPLLSALETWAGTPQGTLAADATSGLLVLAALLLASQPVPTARLMLRLAGGWLALVGMQYGCLLLAARTYPPQGWALWVMSFGIVLQQWVLPVLLWRLWQPQFSRPAA